MATTTAAATLVKNEMRSCETGGPPLTIMGNGLLSCPESLGMRFAGALIYMVILGWFFLGVAIVSDVFMGAIETITSKKKRVTDKVTGKKKTIKVWNDTVANLTLMALGSSAPEILLSLIELLTKKFFAGDLGPSTIVGSAAFNLLGISAVCVMAIPNGEIRKICDMPVFAITASFSIFAYVWLLIILVGITPNRVDVVEGFITLMFFPLLVGLAFAADRGWIGDLRTRQSVVRSRETVVAAEMSKEELAEMIAKVRREINQDDLSDEKIMAIIENRSNQNRSRAQYRIGATRQLTGTKKMSFSANEITDTTRPSQSMDDPDRVLLAFQSPNYAVLESQHSIKLKVVRSVNTVPTVKIKYRTLDGTAHAGSDYQKQEGELEFKKGETEKEIEIIVIDDQGYEEDEEFFVELHTPSSDEGAKVILNEYASTTVTIIDDDDPGVLKFAEETLTIVEMDTNSELTSKVQRFNGSTGVIKVKYHTENNSAISPNDFDALEDELTFASGQTTANISVNIKARGRYEGSENFRLVLSEITGGAKFDEKTDGQAECNIQTIIIQADDTKKEATDKFMRALRCNWDKTKVGTSSWKEQFHAAIYPNGSAEGMSEAGAIDWILHILSFPWKILFAMVPPTDLLDGWVCFFCSLAMIGVVTAFIGDIATLLGCCLDIKDSITAITFVALGTSLPDTFASKTAAVQDPFADASIGNITGSNSVNVFLGLGLPWTVGSIYWLMTGTEGTEAVHAEWALKYPDKVGDPAFKNSFVVEAGNLAFSVGLFTINAILAISVLMARRKVYGGELGGPAGPQKATAVFLVFLWLVYVAGSWIVVASSDD